MPDHPDPAVLADSLAAVGDAFEAEYASEERERFVVDTDEKAAWALRKMATALGDIERVKRLAEPERTRLEKMLFTLDRWVESETAAHQRDVEFFTALLERWAIEQRRAGRKSVSLPYGKVSTRSRQTTVEFDEAAFVNWAAENGRLELLTLKPSKSAVKEAALEHGEMLPGVEVVTYDDDDASVQIKPDVIP